MPKRIREYTAADWQRFHPLTHALKTSRYRRIDQIYMKRAARSRNAAARTVTGRAVLATIAFNDPECDC
jgi:hypothetical protein